MHYCACVFYTPTFTFNYNLHVKFDSCAQKVPHFINSSPGVPELNEKQHEKMEVLQARD